MAFATKYFWDNGSLGISFGDLVLSYTFCSWFTNKSAVIGIRCCLFKLKLTKVAVETIFYVVQPIHVSLSIIRDNPRIDEICSMYDCKYF